MPGYTIVGKEAPPLTNENRAERLYVAVLNNNCDALKVLLEPWLAAAAAAAPAGDEPADAAKGGKGKGKEEAKDGEEASPEEAPEAAPAEEMGSWLFVDVYGWTPLHWATSKGFLEAAQIMLTAGADVNTKNKFDGRTALMRACEFGHHEVVSWLVEVGAEVSTGNNEGNTALHIACGKGQMECTKVLLAAGAKRETVNYWGHSPAMAAAAQGHAEALLLLLVPPPLEEGAEAPGPDDPPPPPPININLADRNGWTVLHHACSAGHEALAVQLIKELKCDKDTLNISNKPGAALCTDVSMRSVVEGTMPPLEAAPEAS